MATDSDMQRLLYRIRALKGVITRMKNERRDMDEEIRSLRTTNSWLRRARRQDRRSRGGGVRRDKRRRALNRRRGR